MKNVLIIKIAALGDVIMALPLAFEIKARYPDAKITWVVGHSARPLVEEAKIVDRIIEIDDAKLLNGSFFQKVLETAKTWLKLLRYSFDVAFNLHLDKRYWLFVLGRTHLTKRQLRPSAGRQHTESFLCLIDEKGPVIAQNSYLVFPRNQKRESIIGIAPGGAKNLARDDKIRRWPIESYRELAKCLVANGHKVVILGGHTDEWVRHYFDDLAVEIEIDKYNLPQFLDRLAQIELLVTHDAGPLHMANAVGTKVIAMFGSTLARNVFPRNNKGEAIELEDKLPCQPCYNNFTYANCTSNECLKRITVDRVLNVINRHWNKREVNDHYNLLPKH